ncbi:NXPE family member 3-like isoform X1 [Haliotis rufescens]|uniref:NXPE family member 3-like isoform X1 n=1 Tax=Haliotis rufescens TaxID=6454 RepID=UPI00201F11E2|nr:NXPE family member 3-like isoform X1 [Haliotis rufescens]
MGSRLKTFSLLLVLLMVATVFLSWPNRFQIIDSLGHQFQATTKHTSEPALKSHIEEEDMVNDSNVNDVTTHASGSLSRMSLSDIKHTYQNNEMVKIKILLFDRGNRSKTRGGDMLVVWMKDPQRGAASAGTVTDHGNGTYTGVLRALWTGRAIIRAAMISSRERMTHIYRSFRNGYFGKNIVCTFRSNITKETTSGYMDMRYMKKHPFCNLTADYFGVTFYSGKPQTKGLGCHDWTETSLPHNYMTFGADTRWFAERTSTEYLTDFITINISSNIHEKDRTVIPTTPCSQRNFRDTWLATPPVGFSYNNTWRPLSCWNSVPVDTFNQCLANRTLRLFGDSTARQMFGALYSMLGFTITKGPPEVKKSKKRNFYQGPTVCEAYHTKYNYTVYLLPHGFPMWFAEANKTITQPVFARLDDIPPGSTDIILINLYAHFHFTPIHIYRARVHRTKLAIENLLKRSPGIKIAIKSPHKFSVPKPVTPLGGMWGPAYENILKKEFVNLYDRVLYLDIWDMTVAFENEEIHPNGALVNMMLQVFLGFICGK